MLSNMMGDLQGRPKKGPDPAFSLSALVPVLEKYVGTKVCFYNYQLAKQCTLCAISTALPLRPQVLFASDCVGEEVQRGLAELENGEVNMQACACLMLDT